MPLLTKIYVQLTCVNLIDSFYCTTPENYVSAVLLSLSTMLHLELPHVNVLSKIDLIQRYGKLGNMVMNILILRQISTWSFTQTLIMWMP